jgi:aspartyl-tRNA(Asn)/glutamyl-tRNA(Gln) amidotransferase subunit C
MKIDLKMIKHLASLSALELDEKELEDMKKDFEKILDLVDQIEKSEISEKYQEKNIIPLSELREDNAQVKFSQEEVLANAPKQRRGYFVVPKVVE